MQEIFERSTLCLVIYFLLMMISFYNRLCYYSLQNIPQNIRERVPLICYVEDKLYDMYLPLKFYIKGRLEIFDKLESGFYLIDGFWNAQFPFLTTLINEPITTNFTVYTVDYEFSGSIPFNTKDAPAKVKERNFIVSENSLESKGSKSKITADNYLSVLIVAAFKTM